MKISGSVNLASFSKIEIGVIYFPPAFYNLSLFSRDIIMFQNLLEN